MEGFSIGHRGLSYQTRVSGQLFVELPEGILRDSSSSGPYYSNVNAGLGASRRFKRKTHREPLNCDLGNIRVTIDQRDYFT